MNVVITPGTGASSVAAEVISTLNYQQVKIVDGTASSTTPLKVNADGSITASIYGNISVTPPANQSVSGTIGASIIGTVPVTGSFTTTAAFTMPSSLVSGVTSIVTSTSQTSVLATAPSAQRNYISQILVTNGAATATFVDVMDGPNVLYSGYAAASGGGFAAAFPTPLKQSNTVTSIDIKARAQASIIAAITGFTAA